MRFLGYILVVFCAGAHAGFSVTHATGVDPVKVDSLKMLLNHFGQRDKYDVLRGLVLILADEDNVASLQYAYQANELAVGLQDTTLMIESTRWVGQLFRRLGKNDEGVRVLTSALKLANEARLESEVLRISNSLGLAYAHTGRYDSALRYYLLTLRIRTERDEQKEMGITLNNIGLLFYNLGDFEEGREFFARAVNACTRANDSEYLPDALINVALCEANLKNFSNAETFISRADSVCGSDCSNYFKMNSEYAKGLSLLLRKQFALARKRFQQSFDVAQSAGDGRFEIEATIGIAKCITD